MSWLKVLKVAITSICILLCSKQFIWILNKINDESYQVVNEHKHDELLPPIITLCPGNAWKNPGPFLNESHFNDSIFSMEEIFHPKTIKILQNESLFNLKEQYSSYYGLCFVMQKLTPERISDYSFQIVVKENMDYHYYLHDVNENEWLFLSVYPYEVPINFIDAKNDDDIGATDIIMRKAQISKLHEKGECQTKPLIEKIHCIKEKLADSISKLDISCKVPALRFTLYNSDHLNYCTTKEDALEVERLMYNAAIKNNKDNVCGTVCSWIEYSDRKNLLSKYVLSKELEKYGEGYHIIWSFYSSLYVDEKVETFVFDFDAALTAFGGSLGLFLGWSVASIIMSLAIYINNYFIKNEKKSKKHKYKTSLPNEKESKKQHH